MRCPHPHPVGPVDLTAPVDLAATADPRRIIAVTVALRRVVAALSDLRHVALARRSGGAAERRQPTYNESPSLERRGLVCLDVRRTAGVEDGADQRRTSRASSTSTV